MNKRINTLAFAMFCVTLTVSVYVNWLTPKVMRLEDKVAAQDSHIQAQLNQIERQAKLQEDLARANNQLTDMVIELTFAVEDPK